MKKYIITRSKISSNGTISKVNEVVGSHMFDNYDEANCLRVDLCKENPEYYYRVITCKC